jgi:hypothetical protein
MATTDSPGDTRSPGRRAPADAETTRPSAWELVEAGRYRPLRTRGSFPGRELG